MARQAGIPRDIINNPLAFGARPSIRLSNLLKWMEAIVTKKPARRGTQAMVMYMKLKAVHQELKSLSIILVGVVI